MNIFYLDKDPNKCAVMHNNKHCVKMILEYSQLLSTAHRLLDGKQIEDKKPVLGSFPVKWRKRKSWELEGELNDKLYRATHVSHPSAIWVRESDSNYKWLHNLLVELCGEYTFRYGKIHKCQFSGLVDVLEKVPNNITSGKFTEPTPAMPDKYKVSDDSTSSYRNYYIGDKQHIAFWKNRNQPDWFVSVF